jgi:iron-sulfur cluster assembly accessory protein
MNKTLSPDNIKLHVESRNLHPAMTLSITEAAAMAAKQLQADNPDYNTLPLRVYIDGKGCDGFYYGVAFDAKLPDDFIFNSRDIQLIVDPSTLQFVYGSVVDWISDDRGTGFLVLNPNHERFRGKFYKKSAWSQVLERQ